MIMLCNGKIINKKIFDLTLADSVLYVCKFLLFIFSCAGVFVAVCELSLADECRGDKKSEKPSWSYESFSLFS